MPQTTQVGQPSPVQPPSRLATGDVTRVCNENEHFRKGFSRRHGKGWGCGKRHEARTLHLAWSKC